MEAKSLYDFDNLKSFRHELHQHPELSYQEFNTKKRLIEKLSSYGVKESQIRCMAKTAFTVDIHGKAPKSGKPYCVAIRADMDGLPIKETTKDIDYKSVTNAAHMCGHDSHMTCAIGGAAKILEKIDQIPEDKCVRFLFQPAEEKTGGAFPMVQEGVLEGIDEVYGFHNYPFGAPGKIACQPGFVMSTKTIILFKIHGKGGHASEFDKLNDPIQAAVDIHNEYREIIKYHTEKKTNFSLCMPVIHCGDAPNVIANTCEMRGTMRSFELETTLEIKKQISEAAERACKKNGCTIDMNIYDEYPALINTKDEAENVLRVAKKVFGEENIDNSILPLRASEDFSYFCKLRPGAFFFLSSNPKEKVLHGDDFNIDDKLIDYGSEMWLRLIEDRFGLEFK